jgi:hypothetical protein
LRHSWQDEIGALLRDKKDFPRNKNGTKKPDNGGLPIKQQSISWLPDKGHRVCQFSNKLYALSKKKKADSEGTGMDAEHLKRNMPYTLRTNCKTKDVTVMKRAGCARGA